MRIKSMSSIIMLLAVLLTSSVAMAAPTLVSGGLGSLGEIERITLNNPADVYSGGVMVVGGSEMIIPRNMLIDLPANRLSLQQIFDQAPAACKAQNPPESGLAKADKCNGSGTGGIATLHAVRTNAGNVIIGDLFIQKAAELVVGVVTYINYTEGYYRVNGLPNDPTTGAMVRLNDPTSRHTIQSGAGCAGGPNCSPDPRFTLDPDNYTNTFATGYPVCIPSTVVRNFTNPLGGPTSSQASASGIGDYLCPDTNRTAALTEPPVADSRRFAPVKVGDSVTAEGNFETVGGVRFLSAHTSTVQKALATSNALGQPDYLFLEEVDIEAPAFQNQRQIAMFIGFTTFAPTDVDIWSIHRDPVSNATHEFPLASVQGCDAAQGGPGNCSAQGIANGPANTNIFKIIYRDDYQKTYDTKLSPCAHLRASPRFASTGVCSGGGSFAKDFAVLSPIPHEIIARTGRKIDSATNSAIGELITIDINGKLATNGEYLFPLGLNLGGIGVAEMSEIDLNLTNTPTIFDGIPWNLDRRLGPSGCLNGGCESLTTSPIGTFALDPFPFSGLDPRTQTTTLPTGTYIDPVYSPTTLNSVRNRIFSYVSNAGTFNGTTSLLPCATGVFPANCPADPPLIPINPTPVLNIFPPIAIEDSATTNAGVPVVINVTINDFPVLGVIDPTTVQIASNPASGTVSVNPANGAITFTPTDPLVSLVSFTYTVANNFGSVSLPGTVTVTVIAPPPPPPVANNDSSASTIGMPVVINVVSNDAATAPATVNPASLMVTAPTGGTAAASLDGTVTYTPPATPGSYAFTYTVADSNGARSNAGSVSVTVTAPAVASGVIAAATPSGTQTVNTPVTITASGAGGTGQYEYRFYVNDGGTFYLIQPYSTSSSCTWLPGKAGTYDFFIEVRSAGTTVLRDAFSNIFAYTVTTPAVTGLTLNPSLSSPQATNTPITFTAQGTGGVGTYEYRFWLNSGAGFTEVQPYSTANTYVFTPALAGNYDIFAEVRIAGSAASRDAFQAIYFYQIQ